MNKSLIKSVRSFIVTALTAFSFTAAVAFAQGSVLTGSTDNFGFFGDMSIKVYCTFSDFIPGSDNSACNTDVVVRDTSNNGATSTTNLNGAPTVSPTKIQQINSILSQGLGGQNARIVYIPVKGDKGDNGTTTIVYQTTIPGASNAGPTALIYPGIPSGSGNPSIQTTVPGEIYSTFIHFLQSDVIRFGSMYGNNAEIANILASTTNTTDLGFQNATGTNLTATGTIKTVNLLSTYSTNTNSTSTNLFSTNASLTNATTTNLFAVLANIWDLYFHNATGTNLSITNLTSTGTFAVATGTIASTTIQNLNAIKTIGDVATFTSATTTNLFSTNASITNATTTYFFAAWARFLNLFVDNLQFNSATGTNLQVANASTTNFSATGTSVLANAIVASSTLTSTTIQNGEIKAGNATLTTGVIASATTTNLFGTNASITNATTTNLFTAILAALNAKIDSLEFLSATGTNLQLANLSTTNINATGTATTSDLVLSNVSASGPNFTIVSSGTDGGQIQWNNGAVRQWNIDQAGTDLRFFTENPDNTAGAVRVNFSEEGVVSANGLIAPNSTITNSTSTNVFSTNASITNATTTNLFTALLTALNAQIDGLTFLSATGTNLLLSSLVATSTIQTPTLNASTTNASTSNSVVSNVTTGNINTVNAKDINATGTAYITTVFASTTNASTTNFVDANGTNATITNSTSTNLFSFIFKSINGSIDSLATVDATFTSATTTNFRVTNIFAALTASITNLLFANATGTNATTTNFFSSSIFGENSMVTSGTSTNYFTTNFVGLNSTSTNLVSVNSTSTNLFATNFFADTLKVLSGMFTNLGFVSATGTNILVTDINATGTATIAGLLATNSTTTNASTTNFSAIGSTELDVTRIQSDQTGAAPAQLIISGKTNKDKQLLIGYNITSDFGSIQPLVQGVAFKNLVLNALGGNVGIGNSNPGFLLHTGNNLLPNGAVARFENAGGTCDISPDIAGGITCTSDENRKKDIEDYTTNATDKINQIAIKEFRMKSDSATTSKQVGFIAQQIETIFPGLVITGTDGYKEVSYVGVIPFIIKSLQEMKTSLFSERVTTNQLCIGQTCINEQDLQDFKAWKANQNNQNNQ